MGSPRLKVRKNCVEVSLEQLEDGFGVFYRLFQLGRPWSWPSNADVRSFAGGVGETYESHPLHCSQQHVRASPPCLRQPDGSVTEACLNGVHDLGRLSAQLCHVLRNKQANQVMTVTDNNADEELWALLRSLRYRPCRSAGQTFGS